MNQPLPTAPVVPVRLQWTTRVEYGFSLSCLRQSAHGVLEADLGVKIPGAIAKVDWTLRGSFHIDSINEPDGSVRLRLFRRPSGGSTIGPQASVEEQTPTDSPKTLDGLLSAISVALSIDALDPVASAGLLAIIRTRIGEKVSAAIGTKLSHQLTYLCEHAGTELPLIDCTLAATEPAREAHRAAITGNLTPLFEAAGAHVQHRASMLSSHMPNQVELEIHLPYLERGEWKARLETLAQLQIEQTVDGRLIAFAGTLAQHPIGVTTYQAALILAASLKGAAASKFTLAFTDSHAIVAGRLTNLLEPLLSAYSFSANTLDHLKDLAREHPREYITASFTLKIPGSLATAWLKTPDERDLEYFATYATVSKAVQAALRRWMPYVYFNNLERCRNHGASYSMLVYRFSRPFRGTPRSEFTYDVLNPGTFGMAFRPGRQKMIGGLQPIVQALIEHGDAKTAKYYINKRRPRILAAVSRQWNSMHALFTCDKLCVNQLVKLGLRANRLNRELAEEGAQVVKDLPDVAADLAKTFDIALRRLCECQEFVPFGPMVLVEATAALNNALGRPCEIQAMLEIGGINTRKTFFNPAYRLD